MTIDDEHARRAHAEAVLPFELQLPFVCPVPTIKGVENEHHPRKDAAL